MKTLAILAALASISLSLHAQGNSPAEYSLLPSRTISPIQFDLRASRSKEIATALAATLSMRVMNRHRAVRYIPGYDYHEEIAKAVKRANENHNQDFPTDLRSKIVDFDKAVGYFLTVYPLYSAFANHGLTLLDEKSLATQLERNRITTWEAALSHTRSVAIPFKDIAGVGVLVESWGKLERPVDVRWAITQGFPLIHPEQNCVLLGYSGNRWIGTGAKVLSSIPFEAKAREQVYHITSFKVVEMASKRPLNESEIDKLIKERVRVLSLKAPQSKPRPKTALSISNIASSHQFAETVDTITASLSPYSAPNVVRVRLTAGPNVTWWKAIRLYKNNVAVAAAVTQDAAKSGETVIQVDENSTYKIEFLKAKIFGKHTPIKTHTIDLWPMRGKTLTFHWSKDSR